MQAGPLERAIITDSYGPPFTDRGDLFRLLQKCRAAPKAENPDKAGALKEARTGDGTALVCVRCGHCITHNAERISVGGSHRHTFANPHGFFFHIGCFRTAPGCLAGRGETSAYSWFTGYAWCVEVCGSCFTHLGWGFRSGTDRFHGLILDKLVEKREAQA
jgi:hypothetical protein